jgi:hypothetical protein
MWGSDRIVFPVSPLNDEWERYYSLDANAATAKPVLLTTTNGLIEDATSAALSGDGKTLTTARTPATSSAGTSGPYRQGGRNAEAHLDGRGDRDLPAAARVRQAGSRCCTST